jgi:hypothetical protein
MTLALIAAVAATAALVVLTMVLAGEVPEVVWPDEEPLHVRDDRAHDLQLTHLARLVAAQDPTALHVELVQVVDQLLGTTAVLAGPAGIDPRSALPAEVRRFLEHPPLDSPDRYRRQLAAVLDRLEEL